MNKLLSVLTGTEVKDSRDVVKKAWNNTKPPYVSGFVLDSEVLYNICPGKVVDVNNDEDGLCVTVLINNSQIIRYTHMKEVFVEENSNLFIKDMIGFTTKNSMLEYCTDAQKDSIWPIRIHNMTFYKHNPEEIIQDKLRPTIEVDDRDWEIPASSKITESIDKMLSNNKGD